MKRVFFRLSDKASVRRRRKLLLRYPLLFNFFFITPWLLLVVTTAVEELSIVDPGCTLRGGSSLIPDSHSPSIFPLLSLRRSVKAKELEAMRMEDG